MLQVGRGIALRCERRLSLVAAFLCVACLLEGVAWAYPGTAQRRQAGAAPAYPSERNLHQTRSARWFSLPKHSGFWVGASLAVLVSISAPARQAQASRGCSVVRCATDGDAEAQAVAEEAAKLRAEVAEFEQSKAATRREQDASKFLDDGAVVGFTGVSTRLQEVYKLKKDIADEGAGRLFKRCKLDVTTPLKMEDVAREDFSEILQELVTEKRAAELAAEAGERERVKENKELEKTEQVPWRPEDLNNDDSLNVRLTGCAFYVLPLLDALQLINPALSATFDIDTDRFPPLALLFRFPLWAQIIWILFILVAQSRRQPRLVRFNAQQAVFLDISLIILSLVIGLIYVIVSGDKLEADVVPIVPAAITCGIIALAMAYSMISTLLGKDPDLIPVVSDYTKKVVDGDPLPGFGSGDDKE